MALPVVVKEHPDQPEVKQEDLLAQERAQRQALEQRFYAAEAAANARIETMERRQYNAPAPQMSAAEAQQDLGLSAQDIAADPDKALKLLSDHIRKETIREVEARYKPIVDGLSEQAHSSQVQALSGRKYAQDLMPLVEEYFAANPQERYIPGKAQEVYERLVGRNLEVLEKRAQRATETTTKNYGTSRVEEPPIRSSGALRLETADSGGDEDAVLTEGEEYMRQEYNIYGANISKKEWAAISAGKVFPKRQGSDWQAEAINKGSTIARARKVAPNVE